MIKFSKTIPAPTKIRQRLSTIVLFCAIAVFYLSFGCPIKLLTGISCPGCGMSRAVLALLKFDFALAFEMHPLVFLLPFAAVVFLTRRLIPKKILTILCIAALLILFAVYVMRLTQTGDIISADFESGLIYKIFN